MEHNQINALDSIGFGRHPSLYHPSFLAVAAGKNTLTKTWNSLINTVTNQRNTVFKIQKTESDE